MEFPSVRPENPFHARSISLPTRSHPLTASVEEEIAKLRQWQACSTRRADMICAGLFGLSKVYECVKEMLQQVQTQQSLLHHRQKKWVEEVMDTSIRMVDLCGSTRDLLLHMKEIARDVHSSLRTGRIGESRVECGIKGYICSRNNIKKDIKKCIADLKLMKTGEEFAPLLNEDSHVKMLVRVMKELEELTIAIFRSSLSWIAASRQKAVASKWSLVSRIVHNGAVTSRRDKHEVNEVESVDHEVSSLSTGQGQHTQDAQSKLKDLEVCIDSLEGGLEFLFRNLIQTRASLLNIFTD